MLCPGLLFLWGRQLVDQGERHTITGIGNMQDPVHLQVTHSLRAPVYHVLVESWPPAQTSGVHGGKQIFAK